MAHQPINIPPGAQDKRRVNIYQLAKEVKRQHGLQNKINARQAQINTDNAITNEEIQARLATLERIVLPPPRDIGGRLARLKRRFNAVLGR